MRRVVIATILGASALTACGGTKIPVHSGYKTEKAKPWKKPKVLAFNDKGETKALGDLSYSEFKRAKWYAVDLTQTGELEIKLEVTPPGDATNDDFDLAIEILDPGNRVISKADAEEEDVGELNKTRTLYDLAPGRYLIHLYLQGRLDSAEYDMRMAFRATAPAEVKSDFPAQVAFIPTLAQVPLSDDTPAKYKPPQTAVVTIKRQPRGPRPPKEPTPTPAVASSAKSGRIINVSVTGGGTQVTIALGSDQGVAPGWKGKISGVSSSFSIASCGPRTCTAVVPATPDQIKAGGGSVTVSP